MVIGDARAKLSESELFFLLRCINAMPFSSYFTLTVPNIPASRWPGIRQANSKSPDFVKFQTISSVFFGGTRVAFGSWCSISGFIFIASACFWFFHPPFSHADVNVVPLKVPPPPDSLVLAIARRAQAVPRLKHGAHVRGESDYCTGSACGKVQRMHLLHLFFFTKAVPRPQVQESKSRLNA
jgi:hypothetical protein